MVIKYNLRVEYRVWRFFAKCRAPEVPRIDIKYPSKGSAQGVHRSLEPSVRRTGACDGELG